MARIIGTQSCSLSQLIVTDYDNEEDITAIMKNASKNTGAKCIYTLTRPHSDEKVDKILKKLHFKKVKAFPRNHSEGLLTMRMIIKGESDTWK